MTFKPNNQSTSEEERTFSDQLLQLLCDNQLFITKIQRAQWNYDVLPLEHYNSIINLLFNCSEIIADQIKVHNGHVPANLSVYLELSKLKEVLGIGTAFDLKKDVILSHNILLEYLMTFMNEDSRSFEEIRKGLITELHTSHTEIYKLLEILNQN